MTRQTIATDSAPAAIGTYSQAVLIDATAYLSGQIALDPKTMELVNDSFDAEVRQVIRNLSAVLEATGASSGDIAKITVYLTDLGNVDAVNAAMNEWLSEPDPARAAVGVSALPKGARVEMDAVAVVPDAGA